MTRDERIERYRQSRDAGRAVRELEAATRAVMAALEAHDERSRAADFFTIIPAPIWRRYLAAKAALNIP